MGGEGGKRSVSPPLVTRGVFSSSVSSSSINCSSVSKSSSSSSPSVSSSSSPTLPDVGKGGGGEERGNESLKDISSSPFSYFQGEVGGEKLGGATSGPLRAG